MKLYILQNPQGDKLEVCDFPRNLLSSNRGMINFFTLYAGRVFGGREGRDWRIIPQPRCLVPMYVNQIVTQPNGVTEYGQSLIVE